MLDEQNVPLPRHPGTDPSYTECCEETDRLEDYRQW
jgi:hypothetical protein